MYNSYQKATNIVRLMLRDQPLIIGMGTEKVTSQTTQSTCSMYSALECNTEKKSGAKMAPSLEPFHGT